MAIRQRIGAGVDSFSGRVMRLRERRGMSKSDLAKAVEVSTTCVWNWEEGNTYPRPGALARLAAALGTTPAYLGEGADEDVDPRPSAGSRENDIQPAATLAETIQRAREVIATMAGLSPERVRVVLDYGG